MKTVPDYVDYPVSMCADDGYGNLIKLPYQQLVRRFIFLEYIPR